MPVFTTPDQVTVPIFLSRGKAITNKQSVLFRLPNNNEGTERSNQTINSNFKKCAAKGNDTTTMQAITIHKLTAPMCSHIAVS
jgi:hypothetical protein